MKTQRKFKCWEIHYKEKNKSEKITKHLGYLTKDEIIKFFGLNDPEIEWYDIKEITYVNSIY